MKRIDYRFFDKRYKKPLGRYILKKDSIFVNLPLIWKQLIDKNRFIITFSLIVSHEHLERLFHKNYSDIWYKFFTRMCLSDRNLQKHMSFWSLFKQYDKIRHSFISILSIVITENGRLVSCFGEDELMDKYLENIEKIKVVEMKNFIKMK